MVEARLHPRLQELLEAEGWSGLTPAQRVSLDTLLARRHALLVAPTGYGKTEAALLPVLHHLLAERDRREASGQAWPVGFKALYVTPLRALNRDLLLRLESWGQRLGLRVGVRHGDTSQAERARQARKPPDILITTPETLQLLLYGDTLRRHLGTVRFVIVDEVHDLAASERGAQLMAALERVEEVIAQPESLRAAKARERPCPRQPHADPGGMFQRIGLSATVADPETVAGFLGGRGRDVEALRVAESKELRLRVEAPEAGADDERLAADLALSPAAVAQVRAVRALVSSHDRVLVFHNTRDGAELLVNRSAMLDGEGAAPGRPGPAPEGGPSGGSAPLLELHHGSLSAEHRMDVERRFKDGEVRGLVATSSLELGIDVGAIDHVVQVQSPRSVARMVQRLGRAGHRVGLVSEGTLISAGPEDHLECVAVARMAEAGELEPLRIRENPLVVLANQLVALTNEYADLDRDWCRAVLTRAAPFADLDEGLFDACWDTLLDVQTVFESEEHPGHYARSGRTRRHFLEHISLIPDERTYRIVDESTKRSIGTVDDAFVAAALHPGALFVMAGRSWRVLEIEAEAQRVRVGPAKELGAVPQWSGQQLPVSHQLAQAVARLRGEIAAGVGEGPRVAGSAGGAAGADGARNAAGAAGARAPAWSTGHAGDAVADGPAADLAPAAPPIRDQLREGLAVPTDRRVTLEAGRNTIVANVALGTRGNDALGRITAALIHQRTGTACGVDSDAYRLHFRVPAGVGPQEIEDTWRSIDPDTLDLLLAIVLRGEPVVRHHLVHVAKHFGALPKELDPNRFSRKKLDALWDRLALQEEALGRLLHDRFDVEAVQEFLRELSAIEVVHQAMGPISRLGLDEMRGMLAPPKSDEKLLAQVRKRIEGSDVMLACTNCRSRLDMTVADIPEKVRCRRCGSNAVACLRPWNKDQVPLLKADPQTLGKEQRAERDRMVRNGHLMGSFGRVAAMCLVARGVGPDTAGRILQKVTDPDSPVLWREILQAELTFARTNVYWRK